MEQVALPKYASRWALPFVGGLGWFFYVWDLFVVVFLFVMFIDVYNTGPWLPVGLVITTIVVSFILWLVNGFWFAPNYQTRTMKSCDPGCAGEVVLVRQELDYAGKVRNDLKYHNDQEHFQGELFRSIFIIIFLGAFTGLSGSAGVSFQPIPPIATNIDIMNYILSKGFIIMILGSAAWSFGRLAETHSDFMWRHMTAVNTAYEEKNGGKSLPLGSSSNNNNTTTSTQKRNTAGLGILNSKKQS